jgi:hypothetical protein
VRRPSGRKLIIRFQGERTDYLFFTGARSPPPTVPQGLLNKGRCSLLGPFLALCGCHVIAHFAIKMRIKGTRAIAPAFSFQLSDTQPGSEQ